MNSVYDTIIIGSGIAGMNLARKLAQAGHLVFLASKEAVTEGSSNYAQGGVAVVSPLNPEDNLDSHIQDTLNSGQGLCNEDLVSQVVSAAWSKVQELIKLGVKFDAHFNLEGSHSYKRILHAGDATGRSIVKPLLDRVSRNHNISISQGTEAISLLKDSQGELCGVRFLNITGDEFDVFASHVVIASGGFAALYSEYSCPSILTGDGLALAYDAGAKLENLEFLQFHPTVYRSVTGENFLISEALRGAGALLRNSQGELFAEKYHPEAELATRDIVSRAIMSEMRQTNSDHVFIDASKLGKEFLEKEFPTIYAYLLNDGFDLSQDYVPVRPAAHYSIGGIKTDIAGRTNVHNLFAIGEAASTGLHGANRLASNSLLECIVMSDAAATEILADSYKIESVPESYQACSNYIVSRTFQEKEFHAETLESIRNLMTQVAGLERKQRSLQAGIKYLEDLPFFKERIVAELILKSALQRKESRGVHFRSDAPKPLKSFERATILSKDSKTKKIIKLSL